MSIVCSCADVTCPTKYFITTIMIMVLAAMVQVTSFVNSATKSYRMFTCTVMVVKNSSARTSISAAAATPKVDTRSSIKCTLLMIERSAY